MEIGDVCANPPKRGRELAMNQSFNVQPKRIRQLQGLMGLGIVSLGISFFLDPTRAWVNLLVNNFYFLSLALAGLFFMAVNYVAGATWWVSLRRVPEAMMSYLPVSFVTMLFIFFGIHDLYHWSHGVEGDLILQEKSVYLNTPFFMVRMVLFFSLWILFARLIQKYADDQRVRVIVSALFIPVFAFTFWIASVDWIQSLEPHWFSTIYALYTFSGLFLHGIAMITLIVILLYERGVLRGYVHENHFHDLGKLVFAFSTFWAYIWLSQYLLIWYSNIPEETVYYHLRTDSEWSWLFVLNLVLNWVIPFLILLPRSSKRNPEVLKRVCITLLVGHWLDIYLLVAPAIIKTKSIGLIEVGVGIGFGAFFTYILVKYLSKVSLVPEQEPQLQESLHYH